MALIFGLTEAKGVFAPPPNLAPTMFTLDLKGALEVGLITIVFTFLLLDIFDSAGTLIGVAQRAGFLDADGRMHGSAGP